MLKQNIKKYGVFIAHALVGTAVFFLVLGTLTISYGKTAQGVVFERFAWFEFALAACLFVWFLASFMQGKISVARMPTDGLFLSLCVSGIVSTLFSGFVYRGVWGTFENPFVGMVGIGSLCVFVFFLASVFSKRLFWAIALAILGAGWAVFGGTAHLAHFPEYAEGSASPLGMAILLSGMMLCVALLPDDRARKGEWYVRKELRFVGRMVLLVSLGIFAATCVRLFSEEGWMALGIALAVSALFFGAKKVHAPSSAVLLTVLLLMGIVMAGIFGTNGFGATRTNRFPDTATLRHVAWKSLEQSPILGYGPGMYGKAYSLHRPAEINQGPHAADRVTVAPGGVWEWLSTFGVLGTILFCLSIVGCAGLVWYTLKNDTGSDNRTILGVFSAWAGVVFIVAWYAYDGGVLFLSFLLTGMLLGSMREKTVWITPRMKDISLRIDPRYTLVFVFATIFAAGSIGLFVYRVGEKAVAGHWAYRAQHAMLPEDVVSFLEKAAERDGKEPEYGRRLGEAFMTLTVRDSLQKDADATALEARFNRAFELLSQSADASPGEVGNVEALARAYETASVTVVQSADSALRYYALAESMEPSNPIFPFKRAVIAVRQVQENAKMEAEEKKKKLAEAEKQLHNALALAPNFPAAYYELAILSREKGDRNDAMENAKKSVEMAPRESGVLLLLASLYMDDTSGSEDAKSLLDRAKEVAPDDPMVYLYLGKYYSVKNRMLEARDAYRQAITLLSDRQEEIKKYIEKLIEGLDGSSVPSESATGVTSASSLPEAPSSEPSSPVTSVMGNEEATPSETVFSP